MSIVFNIYCSIVFVIALFRKSDLSIKLNCFFLFLQLVTAILLDL